MYVLKLYVTFTSMKKIAISSAKGGVGKTTISYRIAKKLKDSGLNVGLFDGDLYGPNILNLFDVNPRSFKSFNDKKHLEPLVVDGIQVASVELILNKQETVFWRGPMISKVLKSMFQNVSWTDLDYLIIGNCILDKTKQNQKLKKNYKNEFELD